MPKEFNISRRKALAALGTIGVASAGAGVGTTAYFSDTESFDGNVVTAGELDLSIGWYAYEDSKEEYQNSGIRNGGEGDGEISIQLGDVKPGDSGLYAFCPKTVNNPAYLWLCGTLVANDENGLTEPEGDVDETPDEGELAGAIEVTASYCTVADDLDANGTDGFDPGDVTQINEVFTGSLAEFLTAINGGTLLDGDSSATISDPKSDSSFFDGNTEEEDSSNDCLCLKWNIPTEVGNEIQSDSVEFDLSFHAQQFRHNENPTSPCADGITTTTGNGFAKVKENFNGDETKAGGARARYGTGGDSGAWELAVGDKPGVQGEFAQAQYTWSSGTTVDWEVSYDESADELSFTFDENTITDDLSEQPDGRVAVQAKSRDSDANVSISGISTDLGSLNGPTSTSATNETSYVLLDTSLDGATSFTVSGQATVTLPGSGVGEEDANVDIVLE
jgi:predicted ribosomally synthesized peptide with SipW-like signal peptide